LTEGVAIYFQWRWIAGLSLIVGLAAAAALFWGTQRLQRGWPVLVCLLFMVPLPDLLATVLGAPLQDIGGKLSAFLLRTLGVRAVLMGRVVMIHELDLRMSEIFAGLQMFMAFCALGFTALCMPQFSRAVKVVLALSLVPLALAVNVVRVVLAGLLFGFGFPYLAETILSGFPQCLLLPLAAVLFWAELKLLDWLWTGPRDALDSIDEQYYSG
jgi:exosortase/archaeosortase family protein